MGSSLLSNDLLHLILGSLHFSSRMLPKKPSNASISNNLAKVISINIVIVESPVPTIFIVLALAIPPLHLLCLPKKYFFFYFLFRLVFVYVLYIVISNDRVLPNARM